MIKGKYRDVYLAEVIAVKPLDGFKVHVTFSNGVQKQVDLTEFLQNAIPSGVFEPIRNNPDLFRAVRVQDGTIGWPNGADIDPDTLYYDGAPPWAESVEEEPTATSK